jgi:hypothetical protein
MRLAPFRRMPRIHPNSRHLRVISPCHRQLILRRLLRPKWRTSQSATCSHGM